MSLAAFVSVRDSLFVICPVSFVIMDRIFFGGPGLQRACLLVYRPLTPKAGHVIASPLFSTTAAQVAWIYRHSHNDLGL